jgi:hypothetical protein
VRFPISITLFKFAIARTVARDPFSPRKNVELDGSTLVHKAGEVRPSMVGGDSASLIHSLIVLQMHQGVQLELILNILHLLGVCFENVVHVVTTIEVPRVVSELSLSQLLDFIELGAL